MSKFSKFIKISGFVLSFLAVFLPLYADVLFKPNIKIEAVPESNGNNTLVKLTMENIGSRPATNLRLTINPEYDIISYQPIFYTEEIMFETTGSKNVIGKMERLANGQQVVITTLLNSTDLSKYAVFATHDDGSSSYLYNKEKKQPDLVLLYAILFGIVVSMMAGISTNHLVSHFQIKNNQMSGRDSINVQSGSGSNILINSPPIQTGIPQPIVSKDFKLDESKNVIIKDLLKRIGKEKISTLLQESKAIAIEMNDKEMRNWIDLELTGYEPPAGKKITRQEIKDKKLIPEYRDINGKFLVKIGDGSVHEMSYPIFMGHGVKYVENSIDQINQGKRVFIKHTFPKDRAHVGGQTADLELPLIELERIIHMVERKLSRYLESNLSSPEL